MVYRQRGFSSVRQKLAEFGQGLIENSFAILVATTLFDVCQVRLIWLNLWRGRGVRRISTGRKTTTRTIPRVWDESFGGEGRRRLVPVLTVEGNSKSRSRVTALGFAHGACAYTTSTNCTATGHRNCLS